MDATLIRADVSGESLTTEHAQTVLKENESEDDTPKGHGRPSRKTKKPKPRKYSTTDPDASMTTSSNSFHMEPFYKQHGAVDDHCGVVVNVDITTGQDSEGSQLPDQIERIESNTGQKIQTLSADAGYGHGKNFAYLERNEIDAIIPPQNENTHPKRLPARLFKYDALNKIVTCPAGKTLTKRSENKQGWAYRSRAKDCTNCKLKNRCLSENVRSRTILISHGYEALLRARRRRRSPDPKFTTMYRRHRWKLEGMHGEAKTQHGLRRAVRRGLDNVAIQAYLTAAVINLKRLAKYAGGLFADFCRWVAKIVAYFESVSACRAFGTNRNQKQNWKITGQ